MGRDRARRRSLCDRGAIRGIATTKIKMTRIRVQKSVDTPTPSLSSRPAGPMVPEAGRKRTAAQASGGTRRIETDDVKALFAQQKGHLDFFFSKVRPIPKLNTLAPKSAAPIRGTRLRLSARGDVSATVSTSRRSHRVIPALQSSFRSPQRVVHPPRRDEGALFPSRHSANLTV